MRICASWRRSPPTSKRFSAGIECVPDGWPSAPRSSIGCGACSPSSVCGSTVLPASSKLLRALPELASSTTLPERFKPILTQVREQIEALDQRIEECEREINVHAKANPD